jgi:hypothetical protein
MLKADIGNLDLLKVRGVDDKDCSAALFLRVWGATGLSKDVDDSFDVLLLCTDE